MGLVSEFSFTAMKVNGYTMIELLVVIAIFGILMGIAVVTMRGVGTKDIIKADADRVVAVLRQARN